MEFLRDGKQKNDTSSIMMSYDFQAGTYTEVIENLGDQVQVWSKLIADKVESLVDNPSIMEVGVGEATTMVNVLNHLPSYKEAFGFDISWSRIMHARKYAKKYIEKDPISLFMANLFAIPLPDNSVDVIYTYHSLEPNGGKEKEALQELYRVAAKYIILLEPEYDIASEEGKRRMERNGYVRGLKKTAEELGMEVVDHYPFEFSYVELNPTGVTIIKKKEESKNDCVLSCPVSATPLQKVNGGLYSDSSCLFYPVLEEIPCLLPEYGVFASQFKIEDGQ